jgi:hypothetical protein
MKNIAKLTVAALIVAAPAMANSIAKPTYTKDVAPILNDNCVNCHRPGQIGPMSLLSYQETRPWAKAIAKNVGEKTMPPWHADDGIGHFSNSRKLTQDQIDTIVNWVDQGAKQGNKKDLPEVPTFNEDGWKLGEPDYVIQFDEYSVPGNGPDLFHDHFVKTDLPEDKWITKVEVIPGSTEVLHHVILWQGDSSAATGWVGAWAAGGEPFQFPEKTGRELKKGAVIRGDMHYHPSDSDHVDATRVGFHFADTNDIEKELINLWVMNVQFSIPAGDGNHEVHSTFEFPQDSVITSLTPHMHYRGKDFDFTAVYPDGTSEKLLQVSKYDFNWQTTYELEEQLHVPKGTRIDCVAHFDNSAENPDNPDYTKDIQFGPESYDEMMIGFIDYYVEDGVRPMAKASPLDDKLASLVSEFPGEVYRVMVRLNPAEGLALTAMHLPKTGDGGWHVPMGSIAVKAPIHDIKWVGNNFEAILTIPGQGDSSLTGTLDSESGMLKISMKQGGGPALPLVGSPAK